MYNSIISQAIRKNAGIDRKGGAPLSAAGNNVAEAGSSYMGGPPKRGGTSSSKYNDAGRVTVGLSTSSSMIELSWCCCRFRLPNCPVPNSTVCVRV